MTRALTIEGNLKIIRRAKGAKHVVKGDGGNLRDRCQFETQAKKATRMRVLIAFDVQADWRQRY